MAHINCTNMVPVPFHHHGCKPTIFDDKLVPNLEKKDAEKEVNKWWKSIPIPWKGLHMLIIHHGELKGQTAIIHDVAFGHKNSSCLALYVELKTFGSMKWWIEYEDAMEEQ